MQADHDPVRSIPMPFRAVPHDSGAVSSSRSAAETSWPTYEFLPPAHLGDPLTMRFRFRMPKVAGLSMWFPTVLLAATMSGCDSTPDANSEQAKQQIQARQESIQKSEQEAADFMKKKNKSASVPKSIKGGIKTGQP